MNSKQRGSTVLWALLGLLAFAALAWYCVARHVPVLEQRLQTSVLGAIKPLNSGPIKVEMNGYTANLSGAVQNSSIRDNLLATASSVVGVRSVNDNLQIIAAPITASVDSADGAEAQIVAPASDPTPVEPTETAEPTDTTTSAPSDTPSNTPEDTTPTPETESPENSDIPATPAVTQTTNTGTPTAAVEEPAELNIAVNDRTLTLTGRVQDQRELRPIVESVMTTFDLNYVTNKTTAAQSIGPMSWMDGLLTSLPDMSGIQNPSVDVFDEQINVSGTVNSQAEQDAIVELLQRNLPNLNVVSRLRVDESAATTEATAEAEATVEAITETDATAESEIDATAEASENAAPQENTDALTADENVDPQAQKQAAIEEQFRIEAQKLAEAAAIEEAEQQRIEAEAAESAANEAEQAKEKAVEAARVAAEEKAKEAAVAANLIAEKEAEEAAAAKLLAEKEAEEAATAKRIAEEEAQAAAEDPVTTASNKLSEAFAALPDTRVLFRIGSNELTPDSEDRLDQIATLLLEYPVVPVGIKGHTDNQGDNALNLALSQQRANAVREYLVTQGISIFRLSSFGYGESLPIDTNDTPEGRAANRRIEFSF